MDIINALEYSKKNFRAFGEIVQRLTQSYNSKNKTNIKGNLSNQGTSSSNNPFGVSRNMHNKENYGSQTQSDTYLSQFKSEKKNLIK